MPSTKALTIKGGGAVKRQRVTIDDMRVQDGDNETIRECFGMEKFDGEELMQSMTFKQLQEYCEYIETNRSSARVTEKTLDYIEPFRALKERCEQHDETGSVAR